MNNVVYGVLQGNEHSLDTVLVIEKTFKTNIRLLKVFSIYIMLVYETSFWKDVYRISISWFCSAQ